LEPPCLLTRRISTPVAAEKPAYNIIKQKKSRWWEVRDPRNELVCLAVYRKGAREVVRRLAE